MKLFEFGIVSGRNLFHAYDQGAETLARVRIQVPHDLGLEAGASDKGDFVEHDIIGSFSIQEESLAVLILK